MKRNLHLEKQSVRTVQRCIHRLDLFLVALEVRSVQPKHVVLSLGVQDDHSNSGRVVRILCDAAHVDSSAPQGVQKGWPEQVAADSPDHPDVRSQHRRRNRLRCALAPGGSIEAPSSKGLARKRQPRRSPDQRHIDAPEHYDVRTPNGIRHSSIHDRSPYANADSTTPGADPSSFLRRPTYPRSSRAESTRTLIRPPRSPSRRRISAAPAARQTADETVTNDQCQP